MRTMGPRTQEMQAGGAVQVLGWGWEWGMVEWGWEWGASESMHLLFPGFPGATLLPQQRCTCPDSLAGLGPERAQR